MGNKEQFRAYFHVNFDFSPMIGYMFLYFKHRGAADRPIHARDVIRYTCDNSRNTKLRKAKILSLRSALKKKYAVAQLVEALLYKLEGRAFDSLWCHWNFSFA